MTPIKPTAYTSTPDPKNLLLSELSSPSPLPAIPKNYPVKRSRVSDTQPLVLVSPSPENPCSVHNSPAASVELSPSKTIIVDTKNLAQREYVSPEKSMKMRNITAAVCISFS